MAVTTTKRVFHGSWGIIVLLAILCWPIAIVYYFMKSEKIVTKK
ncbi:MAG: hypothetical protein PHH00_03275 [Candidatus Nanoarchaeia archaeon]|nr:hypothetical protein [Candidatus Nanoarchaeia archaeon]